MHEEYHHRQRQHQHQKSSELFQWRMIKYEQQKTEHERERKKHSTNKQLNGIRYWKIMLWSLVGCFNCDFCFFFLYRVFVLLVHKCYKVIFYSFLALVRRFDFSFSNSNAMHTKRMVSKLFARMASTSCCDVIEKKFNSFYSQNEVIVNLNQKLCELN